MSPGSSSDPVPARAGDTAVVTPRPASTVVLLRRGAAGPEVLLTHRPATMAFGPGLHVFPGGAVEPGDADVAAARRWGVDADACAASWARDLAPGPALGHAIAAVRELYEEAGVLLAERRDGRAPTAADIEAAHQADEPLASLVERLQLRLRVDRLVPLSHWVTPPAGMARRFDARFFVADAEDGTGFRLDPREVAGHQWIRASDALEAFRAGAIDLWAPTATPLRQLEAAHALADVRSVLSPAGRDAEPQVERVGEGVVRVRTFGAGGLPGRAVCTYVVGRERVVIVDPGDPNEPAAEAILGAVEAAGASVAALALTSPDPGHAGGIVSLALRTGAPVVASAGVGVEVVDGALAIADGDVVSLGDVALGVVATPGIDAAHIAFDAPSAGVVLTGDLDGAGLPTAIHGGRDERALTASRARIEGLGERRRLGAHD